MSQKVDCDLPEPYGGSCYTLLASLIVTCLDHTEHTILTQLIGCYLAAFLLSAFEVMLAQNQPATSHYLLPA